MLYIMSGRRRRCPTDANPRARDTPTPGPNQSDTERDTPPHSLLSPDPDTTTAARAPTGTRRRPSRAARPCRRARHTAPGASRRRPAVHVAAVPSTLPIWSTTVAARPSAGRAPRRAVVDAPLVGLDRRRRDELEVFDRGDVPRARKSTRQLDSGSYFDAPRDVHRVRVEHVLRGRGRRRTRAAGPPPARRAELADRRDAVQRPAAALVRFGQRARGSATSKRRAGPPKTTAASSRRSRRARRPRGRPRREDVPGAAAAAGAARSLPR